MGTRVVALRSGRHSRWWLLVVVVVVVVAFRGVVAWLDWSDAGTSTRNVGGTKSALVDRTIEAGAVTVKVQPLQLGAVGAVFKVSFDTHSVKLDQDLARQARLVVDGTTWPATTWSGDGPGGHHREGELRFARTGTAKGRATLSIGGLPEPVRLTWDVKG